MKANIKKPVNILQNGGKGPFGGYELQLTIGMIAKNEEKTLEKCLQSLTPILESIPSELIITDTGSTDRTVEIAEQYAAKVLHFEWCDDFAAARNTGLEVARGQWFLFLDGDEWFEDVTELIEFFKSGECDQYGSASYIQRNYHNLAKTAYKDFHAVRIFRRYPGMKFHGIIHEGIARMEPCKYLSCFVHHFGYVFLTKESKMQKFHRNSELLLKQLEEDPENLKAYFQLAQEYMVIENYDHAIDTALKALNLEQKKTVTVWHSTILHHLIKAYYNTKRYQDLMDVCDKYITPTNNLQIPFIDCYYLKQMAAEQLGQYDLAIQAGKNYLKLYQLYQQEKLDQTTLSIMGYDFLEKEDRDDVIRLTAKCYAKRKEEEKALSCLKQLDLSLNDSIAKTFASYATLCEQSGKWLYLSKFFLDVLALKDEDRFNVFVTCAEGYIAAHPKDVENLLHAFADTDTMVPYSLLCRLRLAQSEDSSNSIQSLLEQFTQLEDSFDPLYSDFLYCGMKETIPLCRLLSRFDSEDFSSIFVYLQNQHSDFPEVSSRYLENAAAESPKELYWMLYLLERLILKRAEEKQEDECAELLENYAEAAGSYLNLVYRNDQLEEVCDVLPRLHRFMFWIGKAFTAKQSGNASVYLSSLRKALKAYPVMNNPIQILLSRYEAEEEKRRANSDEFAMLAQKMKNQVKLLIEQGHLLEAGQIAQKLAKLMPDDKDIQRFLLQTSVKPATQEMISELMQ